MEQQKIDAVESSESAGAVKPACNGTVSKSARGKDQPISHQRKYSDSHERSLNGLVAVVVPSSASGYSPAARKSGGKEEDCVFRLVLRGW